jgi:branched-chain amino acid aminotransferase
MKESKYIWKNGVFVPWAEATTHVLTHALHYSTAVFEGIRAYSTDTGPAIFRAKAHYDRLLASADVYHLSSTYSSDDLISATSELIAKNKLASCYIRPILYCGYGEMGIYHLKNPIDLVIAAWEWGAYLGDDGIKNGIRCTISSWEKFSSKALPATAKCTANYANSVLAKCEATERGYDEAILLNASGRIAEGPGENIFVIKDGALITPPVTEDALNGITRDSIMTISKDLGISIKEETFTKDTLFTAEELFFTGTAAEVTPIREIDGVVIGSGSRGPITTQIQEVYFNAVYGRDSRYEDWLTRVSI